MTLVLLQGLQAMFNQSLLIHQLFTNGSAPEIMCMYPGLASYVWTQATADAVVAFLAQYALPLSLLLQSTTNNTNNTNNHIHHFAANIIANSSTIYLLTRCVTQQQTSSQMGAEQWVRWCVPGWASVFSHMGRRSRQDIGQHACRHQW